MGRFVVFEGGEGCGKSTQARRLADRWGAMLTFEPGGTPVGAKLREILLSPETGDLEPRAEALLMAADRAHHVATKIRPALLRGRDVVCDRFVGSSLAYQGHARGLGIEEVRAINRFGTDDLVPDLVVLLVVPEDVAAERMRASGQLDRLEAAGDEFHRKVAEAYQMLAAHEPDRWVVVDGTGPADEVERRVLATVEARLPTGAGA
ncbi:MAG: dTMP kinase [Acidimicrobiales bacterium]